MVVAGIDPRVPAGIESADDPGTAPGVAAWTLSWRGFTPQTSQ
jgi:hypothetical protein